MALDAIGLELAAPYVKGRAVLCLGYPDITARPEQVEQLLAKPRKFTDWGKAHKISWPLPETVDTLMLAGATQVDVVDRVCDRGIERIVDLNYPVQWPRPYGLVINPGTIEHCFDVAEAMFNAWSALEIGGVMVSAAPLSMGNHGFYNIQPTFFADFALANGGELLPMRARDRDWRAVEVTTKGRFRAPPESVLYTAVRKTQVVPSAMPLQGRFNA